jgi:hypothetical protein
MTGHVDSEDVGSANELADVVAFPPPPGDMFGDPRGGDRWMRVTWHHEADVVVLSLWRSATCIATMRVDRDDVPALVASLVGGLAESAGSARSAESAGAVESHRSTAT